MATNVEQIKERLSILEVVRTYLELQKAGGRFRAKCPFHNERTPSFYVSPDRDSFYCFGCSKGGDIFTFVQEIEGIDFKEALRMLAERAGVELTYEANDKEEKSKKEKLRDVMSHAVFFYHKKLSEHKEVVAYLKKRGVELETIKQFRLGYAPAAWKELTDYLISKGFSEDLLEESGLVIKNNETGRTYDRYRNRVMFPIADISGNPIAFSGRIYDEHPDADVSQGKYINNPETLLFNKSKALFGMHEAKQGIRSNKSAVVVEGQMDVVLSHQAGIPHVVAASGTALTEHHVRVLGRTADTVIFAFDADEAGIKATERSVQLALAENMVVKIVALPKGSDPADMVLSDPTRWKQYIDESLHIIDFLIKVLLNGVTDARAKRLLAKERILPYIARLKSSIEQAHFVERLSTELAIAQAPIWNDLSILGGRDERPRASEPKKPRHSRQHTILRHIAGLKFLLDTSEYDEQLSVLLGSDEWEQLLEEFKRNKDALMFEQEQRYQKDEWNNELSNLIRELEIEYVESALADIRIALKKAEASNNTSELEQHLNSLQELSTKREQLRKKRMK